MDRPMVLVPISINLVGLGYLFEVFNRVGVAVISVKIYGDFLGGLCGNPGQQQHPDQNTNAITFSAAKRFHGQTSFWICEVPMISFSYRNQRNF